jgi:hypothetical protein
MNIFFKLGEDSHLLYLNLFPPTSFIYLWFICICLSYIYIFFLLFVTCSHFIPLSTLLLSFTFKSHLFNDWFFFLSFLSYLFSIWTTFLILYSNPHPWHSFKINQLPWIFVITSPFKTYSVLFCLLKLPHLTWPLSFLLKVEDNL